MKYSYIVGVVAGILLYTSCVSATFAASQGGRGPVPAHKKVNPLKVNYGCNTLWPGKELAYHNQKGDIHTIVGEQGTLHTGCDVVFGTKKKASQRFVGWELDANGKKVLREVELTKWVIAPDSYIDDSNCPNFGKGYVKKLIEDANPPGSDDGWGSYWVPGANYCTYTKDWTISLKKFVHKSHK